MTCHDTAVYGSDRRLLTREQVADLLTVSPRTVARIVERGDLATVRLGRLARFRAEDVARLIDDALRNDERPAEQPGVATTAAIRGRRATAG